MKGPQCSFVMIQIAFFYIFGTIIPGIISYISMKTFNVIMYPYLYYVTIIEMIQKFLVAKMI